MYRFLCLIFLFAAMPLLFAASVRQKTVKNVRYSNLYDLMSGNKFRTFEQKGSFNAVGRGYLCVFDKDQRRMLCNSGKIELLHVPHSENNSLFEIVNGNNRIKYEKFD